jgi:hypothetical protein
MLLRDFRTSRFQASMSDPSKEVRTSKKPGFVMSLEGDLLEIPHAWALLSPGDAALSRRIKKDGPSWTVKEPKGRKLFSKGIWAPADRIEFLREQLVNEREDPSYQKKLDASRARSQRDQEAYKIEFLNAVNQYLAFHPDVEDLGMDMATRITEHAIPVGSGTVARTKMIPIEQRAEAATIAWMRHQTTAYDNMTIPREKGKRREVRRMLAKRSKQLLDRYRCGEIDLMRCPLYSVLS